MKHTSKIIASAFLLAIVSCDNPADSTVDAEVSDTEKVATSTGGTTYTFSAQSTIGFVGSKVTGSHDGGFKKFTGKFNVKDGEPQSGSFTIDMSSTWSDAEKLTGKLKSADFFDVANHPESQFEVTSFNKKSSEKYDLSGNLTLRGITKNITFPTTVKQDDNSITVTAEFDINRKDFGIIYAGKTDDLIRDEVVMKLNLLAHAK